MRARKEGADDADIIELLGSNLDGPDYENYQCEPNGGSSTNANRTVITAANTNCYAQVIKIMKFSQIPMENNTLLIVCLIHTMHCIKNDKNWITTPKSF